MAGHVPHVRDAWPGRPTFGCRNQSVVRTRGIPKVNSVVMRGMAGVGFEDFAKQRVDGITAGQFDAVSISHPKLNDKQRTDYERDFECDFSFEIPDLARFRVNAFNQNRGAGAPASLAYFYRSKLQFIEQYLAKL